MRVALLAPLLLAGCLARGPAEPCPAILCPEPPAAECSAEGADFVYRQRIEPLLTDEHPASCGTCHLQGIDLAGFVRATPCASMACLVDKGLVDLDHPGESDILRLIDRGRGGPSAEASAAERAGFLAWIEYSARCQQAACGDIPQPCGPPAAPPPDAARPDAADAAPRDAARPDAAPRDATPTDAAPTDAGPSDAGPADAGPVDAWVSRGRPCDGPSLTLRFQARVMRWRNRCNHCHADDGITAGVRGAPLWLVDAPDVDAARETSRRVTQMGFVDHADPTQSLILLKPLARRVGGLEHGGGDKFPRLDDPAYLDFLDWAQAWAACTPEPPPPPADAGLPHPDGGLPSEAPAPVVALCDCLLARCHTGYHQIYGDDEVAGRLGCLRQGSRLDAEALACRAARCEQVPEADDAATCGPALGDVACGP